MAVAGTLVAGRYKIDRRLGAGGMGQVWLAGDEVLRRPVAIKEVALPLGLSDDEREELRQRTLREARAAARLNHPNVVRIYDVQHGDERPLIVMEYVPARSLLQVIRENGPLPVQQVAGIGLAVLSALDAAHRVGVIHRDVKPSNVLIARDGRVLLTDFGSAMIDDGEGALTRTGLILGSPRYIAPERAKSGISTLESDLWSLGATLYEAVEGRSPYTRQTTVDTLVALATQKPDPVEHAGQLKPVLTGLLQKNPKSRMGLHEAEERLRRIADVQSAVWLHSVPTQRATGRAFVPASPDEVVSADGAAPASVDAGQPETPQPGLYASAVRVTQPTMFAWWRERRSRLIAAGVATATVMVIGVAAYGMTGATLPVGETDKAVAASPVKAGASPGPAQPPSASAQRPNPSADAPGALPPGFKWYNARSGFHVAWPARWRKVQESKTSVTLCAPGGPPFVFVREWGRSDPDLSAALQREETAANLPNYKRIRMEIAPQQDWAEWEYTFTDPKMGALHGEERAVIRGAKAYLIQYRTPAAQWAQSQTTFRIITDTFGPSATEPVAAPNATRPGYVRYRSANGFQVAMPKNWTRIEETRTSVIYCAPGGPPAAGVRAWAPASTDLAVALAREEQFAKLPGYRRISMQVLPGGSGAVWEYTFTDPKMGHLHGLERAFLTPNGAYLLQWRTPAARWVNNLPALGVVTSSFRSTPGGSTTDG